MKLKLAAVLFLITYLLGIMTAGASAAELTFKDIAGEFMCQCGCNLVLKDCETMPCAVKDRLKVVINGMIKNGQSREQIIKVMRVNYKDQILSAPPREGFNWMAYITPFLAVVAGGIGILFIVSVWARHREENLAVAAQTQSRSRKVDKKYNEKLQKELDNLRW